MREPYIGRMVGYMSALLVVRTMNNIRLGPGQIYVPDPDGICAGAHPMESISQACQREF